MNKNHIWIGNFSAEKEFENYLDQTRYYKAWDKYNNEPLKEGEEDIEPGKEVSCRFCQEIGIDFYDEDFLNMRYEPSNDIEALLSHIPADTKKTHVACIKNGISKANSFLCYSSDELEKDACPQNSKELIYLGVFEEKAPTALIEDASSRLGITDLVWIGNIKEPKSEFLNYFDQSEYMDLLSQNKKPKTKHSCGFCQDAGISYYLPQNCHIFF